MPRKKVEEWVEVQEAARIMAANNNREVISPDYVRLLAHNGRIQFKPKDRRQNLYLKSDIEAYKMRPRKAAAAEDTQPQKAAERQEPS